MAEQPRTVVFGLDGAHFELVEPWIEAGELPNLERAVETGVTGDLESVLPPVTSPNWKSYLTGKNPGQFGIFWWENVDTDEERIFYPSHRKNRETEYWEILAEDGRTGVMGVPTTYPPKQAGEFVLSGAPDGSDDGYAYPEELEARLADEYDYRVTAKSELRATPDEAAEEILELIDTRFTVARDLFEEYDLDFLQVTTFYINSLHHYFWDHEYTKQGWKIIDDYLGEFLGEGHDVVLMSDHGSNEIETVFHINSWLEREGHLRLDAGAAKLVHRMGVNRDRVLRVLSPLGLQGLAKRFAPQFVLDLVPDEQGELPRESKTSNIAWEATDVVASGQGPIYLTADEGTAEYERIRERLMEQLEGLEGPNGERIVAAVHRGEDVYSGAYADEAPNVVVEQAGGVHIQGSIGREEVFSEPTEDGWKGENKREGLFVAAGPSFDEGDAGRLSILDLAPTLLHLRGQQVPGDMDGEVRRDVFAPDSPPATTEPAFRQTSAKEEEIRRIRQLARTASFS
jgi:predicted AlkP superfamily phosphohydrolase/phosphomutase